MSPHQGTTIVQHRSCRLELICRRQVHTFLLQVSYRLLNPSFPALLVLPPLLKFLTHLHTPQRLFFSSACYSLLIRGRRCKSMEGSSNRWREEHLLLAAARSIGPVGPLLTVATATINHQFYLLKSLKSNITIGLEALN